jgi:hypothetical protein
MCVLYQEWISNNKMKTSLLEKWQSLLNFLLPIPSLIAVNKACLVPGNQDVVNQTVVAEEQQERQLAGILQGTQDATDNNNRSEPQEEQQPSLFQRAKQQFRKSHFLSKLVIGSVVAIGFVQAVTIIHNMLSWRWN